MKNSETREEFQEKRFYGGLGELGFRLSREQIEAYLKGLEDSEYSAATLQSYQRALRLLYLFLPEDKYIQEGTLDAWRDFLVESGYSVNTVNVCAAAARGLMIHLGFVGIQAPRLPKEESEQPELTRAEYLRLLSAARISGKERAYLLVKVFGVLGLCVGDMENLTAEAVREGKVGLPSGSQRIPDALREELLHFMDEQDITSGPVFLSRVGTPQGRTVITNMIKTLCYDARVPEEKANPRCLRKLYLSTQDEIRESLSRLAEQTYDRLLEQEQRSIGWVR